MQKGVWYSKKNWTDLISFRFSPFLFQKYLYPKSSSFPIKSHFSVLYLSSCILLTFVLFFNLFLIKGKPLALKFWNPKSANTNPFSSFQKHIINEKQETSLNNIVCVSR